MSARRRKRGPLMRQYNDPCGLARALNLVGERWALLIVRELLLGPKRFTALRAGLSGISPNVLSQRLAELSQRGIVEQGRVGPPVNVEVYQLTPLGGRLEPVLIALADWGSQAQPPSSGPMSVDALLLAMRTTANLNNAHRHGIYQLLIVDDAIAVELSKDGLIVQRRFEPNPLVTIQLESAVLRALMFGGLSLQDAVNAGEATVTGDIAAAESFFGLFERPKLIQS